MLKDELRKLPWLSCKELSVYANIEPMIICKLNWTFCEGKFLYGKVISL